MGNILSILQSSDDYEHVKTTLEIDNTDSDAHSNVDITDVDDIDFIAADLILTTNTAHLSTVVGNSPDGSERTTELVQKISTAIQDDVAVAKYSRIVGTSVSETETMDIDTARQEVSRFYLNIARVLVAISLAIQPESDAEIQSEDTDDILTPDFSIARMSFCGSRINRFAKTVANGIDVSEGDANQDIAEMITLGSHYGLPELEDLYFDADYDQETGSFLGMKEETKSVFEQDLARFYYAFTGQTSVPESIKRFADIPLHDNTTNDNDAKDIDEPSKPLFVCKFDTNDDVECDPLFTNVHGDETDNENISVKSQLLTEFAEHLQQMIKSVIMNRRILVEKVNRIFVFGTQTVDGEKTRRPRVRAYLTTEVVNSLMTETHQIITKMSAQCELDNRIGTEMFTALHAIQTLESNTRQIKSLEDDLNNIVYA
jgi:hypothetical protein